MVDFKRGDKNGENNVRFTNYYTFNRRSYRTIY